MTNPKRSAQGESRNFHVYKLSGADLWHLLKFNCNFENVGGEWRDAFDGADVVF